MRHFRADGGPDGGGPDGGLAGPKASVIFERDDPFKTEVRRYNTMSPLGLECAGPCLAS